MSSKKTPNLELHEWVPDDYVQMEEFNENFRKLDEKTGDLLNTSQDSTTRIVEVTEQLSITDLKIEDKTNSLLKNLPLNVFNTNGGLLGELVMREVNPVWFGAKPDNAKNYTSEFSAAIQYLVAIGGGTLKIPAGEWRTELFIGYSLRETKWIGGSGITIEGVGKEAIVTLFPEDTSIGGELISVRGKSATEKLRNITIRNLTVRNLEDNKTVGNGIGVVRTENILIENVNVENCTNYGITVEEENEGVKLQNITANNNAKSGVALTSSSTRRVTVTNLTAHYNTEHGLYCTYNNGIGMDELVIIAPNLRFNGKAGMFGSHFDNSQIIGGNISDNTEEGVFLHNSKAPKLIGISIQRNGLEGVRTTGCENPAILGANIADNAKNAVFKVGIRLHNSTDRATVTNSFIGNIETTNQVNGIRVDATNVVIDHNTYANTGASVLIGTGFEAKIDGVFCDANIGGSVPSNLNRRVFHGLGEPINGDYIQGETIHYLSPVAGGYAGMKCVKTGRACTNIWKPNTAYTAGTRVYWGNYVYVCAVNGTSTDAAPFHTSGTLTTGGVQWTYEAVKAVFKDYGLIELIGTGSPEGVVTASPSSIYKDTINGDVYVKKTGTGNIGWKVVTLGA